MKYSNYDIQGGSDGVTAYELDSDKELAHADNYEELEKLMQMLEKAYEEGVEQGIKEHKEEMRNKLGL